jgi:hypothetical protein
MSKRRRDQFSLNVDTAPLPFPSAAKIWRRNMSRL